MNDLQYHPRLAESILARAAQASPVVVVMGARQTGKSTLARMAEPLRDHRFVTLDDLEIRERAARVPDELVHAAPRMVIDEVQREPDLLLAIKRAVDRDRPRIPGRFVLTGSANLLLMKRVSETLAGRATYISLWPLTRRERLDLTSAGIWTSLVTRPVRDWYDLVRNETSRPADWRVEARIGGYPTPSTELDSDDLRTIWFDGYVRTYLERDLQELAAIDSMLDHRRLMRACTLRLGSLLNQAELGRDTSIPRPTVHRYLNLLETSFQAIRLQPYSVNRSKRLVKSPKLYWNDTGIAMHLSGEDDPRGAHLENLVLSDLLAWKDGQIPRPEVLYWRTSTGIEVDFVIELKGRLFPIEIKAARGASGSDARSLVQFRDEYPKSFAGGLLLHDGDQIEWIADRVLAAPWHRVV